jgi:hypothetical protein
MHGLEIHDTDGRSLSFDLKDVLSCLGEDVTTRTWTISGVECTGEAADDLHRLSDEIVEVPGELLATLAERVDQVIEGEFCGRLIGETVHTLVVRAIDSTLWEVFGDDGCLSKIRARFKAVRPAHPDAG